MKTVTIAFSNFWGADEAFTAEYMYRIFPFLRGEYDLRVLAPDRAEYVFFSVYGYIANRAPNATRILISGEAGDHFAEGGKMAPGVCASDFYHYGLTCAADNHHPNHIFLPQPYIMLNLYNDGLKSLIRPDYRYRGESKMYFCDFIYGNGYSQDRIEFMTQLSRYKRIECAGPVCRNNNALKGLPSYDGAGYRAKQDFQTLCRFSLAMENNYHPGYTTEKLSDPLVARSVPIYSGNPRVNEIFNPESFINLDSFPNWGEAIQFIENVDNDAKVYEDILNAPPFVDNHIPLRFDDSTYLSFFRRIFGD